MGGYRREARGEFEGTKGTDGFGCSTVGLPFFCPLYLFFSRFDVKLRVVPLFS